MRVREDIARTTLRNRHTNLEFQRLARREGRQTQNGDGVVTRDAVVVRGVRERKRQETCRSKDAIDQRDPYRWQQYCFHVPCFFKLVS